MVTKVVEGKLTINPLDVTVSVADKTVPYNGSEQSGETAYAFSGILSGHTATITYTPSTGTLVGEYDNGSYGNDFKVVAGTTDVTNNYNLTTKTPGKLTITDENVDQKLVVTKTHTPGTFKLGDTVTFTITVKNIYNAPKSIELSEIEGVTLEQSLFENVAAGATVTTTATYTIAEADIVAQQFVNTVTAKYTDSDTTYEAKDTVTATEIEDMNAALTVTKTADPTSGVKAGGTVNYTVVVTNSGNVTVKGITLSDTLVTLTDAQKAVGDLTPGASKTITYTYTVTQGNVDTGLFNNTVTATGKDPENKDVSNSATATVNAEGAEAKLSVTKKASPTSGVKVGETVTYTVEVTNSGNVTVNNLTLTDDHGSPTGFVTELAPGASTGEITYTYTVTQADVDAGSIVNVVKANATAVRGSNPDEATATATVTTEAAVPALTVTKTASPDSGVGVGATVTYTVVVTNSGNVTVSGIELDDTLVTLTDDQKAIGTLAPAESKTITYTYAVTQGDVDAGKIDNTATATGTYGGDEVTASDDATVTTVESAAALTVTKEASKTSGADVGDTITYTVVVTNSGNVTVSGIALSDSLVTLTDAQKAIGTLAPGKDATITYTYTVTQADVDAGKIDIIW